MLKKPSSVLNKGGDSPASGRWLRVSQAVVLTGFSRSRFFQMFDSAGGPIRTKYIIMPGKQRGIRLIEEASLYSYLDRFDTDGMKKEFLPQKKKV